MVLASDFQVPVSVKEHYQRWVTEENTYIPWPKRLQNRFITVYTNHLTPSGFRQKYFQ